MGIVVTVSPKGPSPTPDREKHLPWGSVGRARRPSGAVTGEAQSWGSAGAGGKAQRVLCPAHCVTHSQPCCAPQTSKGHAGSAEQLGCLKFYWGPSGMGQRTHLWAGGRNTEGLVDTQWMGNHSPDIFHLSFVLDYKVTRHMPKTKN